MFYTELCSSYESVFPYAWLQQLNAHYYSVVWGQYISFFYLRNDNFFQQK